MKTFKSYMTESKKRTEKLASIKLAMQDAATFLSVLNDLIDDGGDWALELVKDQPKIKKIIKDLQMGAKEIIK